MTEATKTEEQTAQASQFNEQAGTGGQQPPNGGRRMQVTLDASQAAAAYANFCRVTGTPEELIIDLGLNSTSGHVPENPIRISQRIVVSFYTAKRLLAALRMAIDRHEAAFGVLETDISKRLRPTSLQRAEVPPGDAD